MKILSFDIGIKNLAYCALTDGKIKEWQVVDIDADDIVEMADKIDDVVDVFFLRVPYTGWEPDIVLVEQQPAIASAKIHHVLGIILGMVTGYATIVMVNPRNKLTVYDGPPIECKLKSSHARNKFLAIMHCRALLQDSEWIEFFEKQKKKDDLADAYLQALWYIRHRGLKDKHLST